MNYLTGSEMLVSEISEFKLITRIQNIISPQNETSLQSIKSLGHDLKLSIGDDAAVFESSHTTNVVTTDALVENVHFNLDWTSFEDLGWKSIIASQSDIASMGCIPTFAVITLGLRPDLPVDGIVELYHGMVTACQEIGGTIIGGDTVASKSFFISVTMNGSTTKHHNGTKFLARKNLLPSQLLCVTGILGSSAAGLEILKNPNLRKSNPQIAQMMVESHNHPYARVNEGTKLTHFGIEAAMDISDGLMPDLKKMCSSSNVGANICLDQIPVDPNLKTMFPNDWIDLAVSRGEDYELVFSGTEEVIAQVQKSTNTKITIIGEVTPERNQVNLIDSHGENINPVSIGWDHFKSSKE